MALTCSRTPASISELGKRKSKNQKSKVKTIRDHPADRTVLDFKSPVSREDYDRLMNFVYIDLAEKLEDFSDFVRGLGMKKIPKVRFFPSLVHIIHLRTLDWWNNKAMSPWILSCLIKSQSPMSAEDWDNTPATTN